jgi:hypothetical protein
MGLAVDNIRHYTKKPKHLVTTWVGENWPSDTGDSFALGIPMSVLDVIVAGVLEFSK